MLEEPTTLLLGCSDGYLRSYKIHTSVENHTEIIPNFSKKMGTDVILHHSFNNISKRACVGFSNGCIAFANSFDESESVGIILL